MAERPEKIENPVQYDTPGESTEQPTDSGYFGQSKTVDLKTLLNPGLNPSMKISPSDGKTLKLYDSKEAEEQDVLFQFFTHLSALDPQTIQKLPTTVQYMEGSELRSRSISKRDLLHAIISCCDNLLLPDVFSKLYTIGLAIPIIIPCANSHGHKKLLCHAISKCFHRHFNPKTEKKEKIYLADFKALCVSAMRVGNIKFSKSEFLNVLLSEFTNANSKNFYITSEKDTPSSLWSNGTVEAVWHISDQTNGDRHTPPFLLLNARGDIRENTDVQTVFSYICNINILFVSDDISIKVINKIISTLKLISTIVLIFENIPPERFLPDIIVFKREKHSVNDIIDRLAAIIRNKQSESSVRFSASDFEILCSLGGMQFDEERLEKTKEKAQVVVSAVPTSPIGNIETILPFSNHLKQNDSFEDFSKHTNTSRTVILEGDTALSRFLKMIAYDNDEKQTFLSYLNSFLEKKLFPNLCYLDTYTFAVKDHEVSNNSCLFTEEFFAKMEKNAVTVEKFLNELLLMFEFQLPCLPSNANKSEFSFCLASWLLNGNAIDLINFDSRYSPFALAQAAISGVQYLQDSNAFVRVVSVFGEDWGATCVMLNRMLGTNITDGESLCSGGPRVRLIPIKSNSNASVNFEYLLLILLATHSSFKITQDMYSERQDEVLNVLSSLTDLYILTVDQDNKKSEQSGAFQMVAKCLMKKAVKDKQKCCIVFNGTDTLSTGFKDLQDYTISMLRQTFEIILETENHGEAIKGGVSVKDIWANFISHSTINVKLLPALKYGKGFQAEKKYLSQLYDLRNTIFEKLKECNSMPHSFKTIAELLALSNDKLTRGKRSETDLVRSHEKSRSKDKCNMQHNAHDQSNIFNNAIVDPNEIQSGSLESTSNLFDHIDASEPDANVKSATGSGSEFLVSGLKRIVEDLDTSEQKEEQARNSRAGSIAKTDGSQQHDKIADEEQYNAQVKSCDQSNICGSSINKEKRNLMSKPDMNIDEVIKLEIKSFHIALKNTMAETYTTEQKKELVEAYSIQHLAALKDKHPSRTFFEVRSWTENIVTNELKKEKYGNEVNKFVSEGLRDNLHNLTESVVSMEDVRKVKNKFTYVSAKDKETLRDCSLRLVLLSCEYTKFENGAQNMIFMIKEHLNEFSNSVDKLAMCIFLCNKFAFKVHKQHVLADLVKVDKTASKGTVDYGSYVIKYEEPLKFKSLDEKLEWIKPLLKRAFSGDMFAQLAEHISSDNAVNYECIPFDMQTLQKLDINFLKLLPVVSSNNMDHILCAVNDSKLHILGKILGQAPFNFDESFNHVYTMMKNMFTDAPQIDAIQASAFVHVLAWSSTFISVKIHQREIENSVPSFFEKLLPILKCNCNIYANEKLQEEFYDQIYNMIQETLVEHIPKEIENELRRSLLHKNKLFMFKQLFIENMLCSFCQMEDYLSLLAFVERYENCGEKFVSRFLAKIINSNNISIIAHLKVKVINRSIEKAIFEVKKATSICMGNKDETLYSWAQLFNKSLSERNCKVFKQLDRQLQFSNIKSFCDQFCASLERLREILQSTIELPEEGNTDETRTWLYSLPNNMYKEISKEVIGCKEQCPLCGNVCVYSLAIHYSHSTPCHIPIGIKGGTVRNSNTLSSLTCSDLISQENVVTSLEQDEDFLENISNFFQNKHPNWNIASEGNNCIVFWKYIFNHFNRQFSQYFECEEGKVPQEWAEISKEEAVESIAGSNNVSLKESMELLVST